MKIQNQEHLTSFLVKHKSALMYRHGPVALSRIDTMLNTADYELVCQRLTNLNYMVYNMNRRSAAWNPSHIGRLAAGIAIFYLSCGYTSAEYYKLTRIPELQLNTDHEAVYTAMVEHEQQLPPTTMVSELVQSSYHFGVSTLFWYQSQYRSLYGGLEFQRFRQYIGGSLSDQLGNVFNIEHLPLFAEMFLTHLPAHDNDVHFNIAAIMSMLANISRISPVSPQGIPQITRW